MRLMLAFRAAAHVRLAIVLLHVSLGLGWLGERLWGLAKGQMDRAATVATQAGLARR